MSQKQGENNIDIKNEDSGLKEFLQRKVPGEEEVSQFDVCAEKNLKDGEIEKSLAKIYNDANILGVDASKFEKGGWGCLSWLITFAIVLALLAGGVWYYYQNFYLSELKQADQARVPEFDFSAPLEVQSGEDFYYIVSYKNPGRVDLENLEIKLVYPDNFIFEDSYPAPTGDDKTVWKFTRVAGEIKEEIKIKGKLVGAEDSKGVALVSFSWQNPGSSAGFNKDKTTKTTISSLGVSVDIVVASNIYVNQESVLSLRVIPQTIGENDRANFLNSFSITVDPLENIIFSPVASQDGNSIGSTTLTDVKPGQWILSGLKSDPQNIDVQFKVNKKINPNEKLTFHFEYLDENNKAYPFLDKEVNFNVLRNDFNLSLELNGSSLDNTANFGDTLEYTLKYSNKGDGDLENVVVMAILDSPYLDWKNLKFNGSKGVARNNTIRWTKDNVSGLDLLKSGDEGELDFFIDILMPENIKGGVSLKNKNQVIGYASFILNDVKTVKASSTVASSTPTEEGPRDNKSNTIITKINSDLALLEQVRYFSVDNIAIGSGPVPPQASSTTTYRVSWKITNNLHELKDLIVITILPDYITFSARENRNLMGDLTYNESDRAVTWNLGQLPMAEFSSTVEFDISVTPTEDQRGKILALISGTSVKALDKETNTPISVALKAKTTKLEDDSIGGSDGIIK